MTEPRGRGPQGGCRSMHTKNGRKGWGTGEWEAS